tara:strand:- start:126 stop:347 length:222 start_codon:yes stop_codon:yes gene_type:complete
MYYSKFSTLLFLGYRAFLDARWIFKTVRSNRENISSTIYNAYNLPESAYQKVKVRIKKNKFNLSLVITMLGKA